MIDFTLILIIATLSFGVLALLSPLLHSNRLLEGLADFSASIFPILFLVLTIRSFVIEPYRIPSGSMIPTLVVGDFILVKKYKYGLRVPISNNVIVNYDKPEYGDIIVFQYPLDRSISYIKRIVGLPGDKIEYIGKNIFINGKRFAQSHSPQSIISSDDLGKSTIYKENNGTRSYNVMVDQDSGQNFSYTVPEDSVFVLGDNRDNSNDSRYWGPVPNSHIVGEAFYIWMFWNLESNYSIMNRIGKSIN